MLPATILLITLFAEALLSGLYVGSLVHCLRWLLFSDEGWKRREKINWILVKAAVSVPAFLIVNMGFGLYRNIYHITGTLPWNFLRDVMLNASRDSVYLMIEAVLTYRCWVLYGRSWRVIVLPIAWWLGEIIFSSISIYAFRKTVYPKSPTEIIHQRLLHPMERFKSTAIACGVAITLYTTPAIIYKIVRASDARKSDTRRSYYTRIIAESGILYTVTTLINLIAMAIHATRPSDASILMGNLTEAINIPMGGIALNLILIWVYSEQARSMDASVVLKDLEDQGTLPELRFNQSSTTMAVQSKLTRDKETHELIEVSRLSDGASDDKDYKN